MDTNGVTQPIFSAEVADDLHQKYYAPMMEDETTSPIAQAIGEPSEQDLRIGIFRELDAKAREIETLFCRTWVDFGETVRTMRDGGYWRDGGFSSFHSWLKSACPCSRSWAYLAIGALDELKDIPLDELRQMPLANAEILKKLPRSRRSEKSLLTAAKSHPPREFLPHVIEGYPEAHLEAVVTLEYKFSKSQAKKVQAFFDLWRMLHSEPQSDGAILEELMAEWMLAHQAQWEAVKNGEV